METTLSQRRRFLKLLGYAAISVQILPPTGCSSAAEPSPADSLAVTSSRNSKVGHWADHSHILYIPLPLFRTPPPEGASLSTTRAFLHSHEVVLTEAQLVTVARGGTVQVKDTNGTHTFSIELG